MNKLYKALDNLIKVQELKAKSRRQKQEDVIKIAEKCFMRGHISGLALGIIAHKNNGKAF